MRCDVCQGTGVLNRNKLPCGECGGTGVVSCCEGEQIGVDDEGRVWVRWKIDPEDDYADRAEWKARR